MAIPWIWKRKMYRHPIFSFYRDSLHHGEFAWCLCLLVCRIFVPNHCPYQYFFWVMFWGCSNRPQNLAEKWLIWLRIFGWFFGRFLDGWNGPKRYSLPLPFHCTSAHDCKSAASPLQQIGDWNPLMMSWSLNVCAIVLNDYFLLPKLLTKSKGCDYR
jgi:hypothetical protein